MTTTLDIEEIILQTDASGAPVRLEYVRGRLKVEASPASRHQMTAKTIEASLKPMAGRGGDRACFSLQDVLIRFPDMDSSLKRPDITIFCAKPPESDEALEVLPDAIVESVSVGYEEKDLGPDGAPFYLDYVPEVLVMDPRTRMVHHYRAGHEAEKIASPITIDLQCACRVML